MIELVTPRRGAAEKEPQGGVHIARNCRSRSPPNADVAPFLRGACSLQGRRRRRRAPAHDSRIPLQRRDPEFRQWRGVVARYASVGVITPDHTIRIKTWPLIVPAPQAGKLDDFKRAARDAVAAYSRQLPATISPATTRAPAAARRCSIRCRASCWCRASASTGSAARPRMPASPPISPKPRSRPSPTPRPSAASSRSPRPTCSTPSIGRSSRPSSARSRTCRWPARSPSSPARPARSAQPPPGIRRGRRRGRAARRGSRCCGRDRPRRSVRTPGVHVRRHQCDTVRAAFDQVVERLRRRRHRRVERRRRLAGPHRRGRRGDFAQKLRAQFLRPPARRAGRRENHAGAGHRRLPAVQRLEAGGEPGPEFRTLRPAQGRDAVAGAPIRGRLRRRRHPRQRRQRRPHPLGPADRDFIKSDRKARGVSRAGLHERQPARPRGHRRRRCASLPAPGPGDENHRRRHHRRWRQHRGGACDSRNYSFATSLIAGTAGRP